MERTRRQPKPDPSPIKELSNPIIGPDAFLMYQNLIPQAQADEEIVAASLARTQRREKARNRFGAMLILPRRLPLARIREECLKGLERFNRQIAEVRRRQRKAKEQGLEDFSTDFIEQARKSIRPMPETFSELASALPYFDWRLSGMVSLARNQDTPGQKPCGSCWAFAATEAFESRLMYNINRFKVLELEADNRVTQIALSIQGVLDCVAGGGCGGGFHSNAFNHFVKNGARLLKFNEEGLQIDDTKELLGKKGHCTEKEKKGIRALAWDFVFNDPFLVPKEEDKDSIQKMKEALLEHGALAVSVTRDDDKFIDYREKNYPKGVYNIDDTSAPNHAVLLTGWDDSKKAWIILNSFGRDWGSSCIDMAKVRKHFPDSIPNAFNVLKREKGCMYIGWGVSRIGEMAAWIEAPMLNRNWLRRARNENAAK